jgi:hypothetical protein
VTRLLLNKTRQSPVDILTPTDLASQEYVVSEDTEEKDNT